MEYISSDTNVWIDFLTIRRLQLPFRLPYIYLMSSDAVQNELLSPPGLAEALIRFGLLQTQITEEEFYLEEVLVGKYSKLSLYDCAALAIAKSRNIALLTGDGALRDAAKNENVRVFGTLGILDRLLTEKYVDWNEYSYCIRELKKYNGGVVRLPKKELNKRLKKH